MNNIIGHFDNMTYNLSECSFNENNELVLSDGNIITKQDYANQSMTFKLCFNEFKKTGHIKCVFCGLEATIIRRDKSNKNGTKFHWSFYGIKKTRRCKHKEVLFTKDHIIPKSLIAKDTGNNIGKYQIACGPCNWAKGNNYENMTNEELFKKTNDIKKEKWIREILARFMHRYMKRCNYTDTYRGIFRKKIKSVFEEKINGYIESINNNIVQCVSQDLNVKADKDFVSCFNNIVSSKNERFQLISEQFKNLFFNDFKNIVSSVQNNNK